MDMLLIVTLIMVGVLLMWTVFCVVMMARETKKLVVDEGMTGHVVCEKCHTAYDVTAAQLMNGSVVKYKKYVHAGGDVVRIKQPRYSYYAERFMCPSCKKMRFATVENIGELSASATPTGMKMLTKWFAILAIGAAVIIIIFQIPLGIARKDKQRQVEEMRNQMYEQLMQ